MMNSIKKQDELVGDEIMIALLKKRLNRRIYDEVIDSYVDFNLVSLC